MIKKGEELAQKDILRNVLEEARMVLPGIQALFGFQLIAVFNYGFDRLSHWDKSIHMFALILTVCAVGCLMAPASYHRQVEQDTASPTFISYASKLLCIGMAPLLLSICLDIYVVANIVSGNSALALLEALFCFSFLSALWYVVPAMHKSKQQRADKRQERIRFSLPQ